MNYKEILKNRYVQLALALVVGITVGAIFYPSKSEEYRERAELLYEKTVELEKTLEEKKIELTETEIQLDKTVSEFKSFEEETSKKVESLRTENRELRTSAKRKKFKLVKPDGTIVEKEYEESQSEEITSVVTEIREEFDTKVKSIESRWKSAYERRVKKLKSEYEKKLEEKKTETIVVEKIVEKEKIVKVNERKLRTEVGVTTNKDLYIHTSYPLWGPVFIGGGVAADPQLGGKPEFRLGFGFEW
jgi:uncharacterized membrane-anchored protein YhcB (DUF1043 family)